MSATPAGLWVNDVHSGLNATRVRGIEVPQTVAQLARIIRRCAKDGQSLAVAGCRHAMGGQQFLRDGLLLDLREMSQLLGFDRETGLIRAEAGMQWPALVGHYLSRQDGDGPQWSIAQKQTGADHFTLGGSLAANAHGRGLAFRPLIQDVEAFSLLLADGSLVRCSREENHDLFALAIGGYGLFGVMTDVTLRLVPRQGLRRQFSIDERSVDFLQTGVLSCYAPTEQPVSATHQHALQEEKWLRLLQLACTDRAKAFAEYAAYYLSTDGQVYWSDLHQFSPYLPDYATRIREMGGSAVPSSLVISELSVPRESLAIFLQQAADTLRRLDAQVIYGTVRLIEKDSESFLAWARDSYACVIFNLRVEHSPEGRKKAAVSFRALLDLAIQLGGSFYLTYHRHASWQQVTACYPQMAGFFERKRQFDPRELFQSDWYRHYSALVEGNAD